MLLREKYTIIRPPLLEEHGIFMTNQKIVTDKTRTTWKIPFSTRRNCFLSRKQWERICDSS
jgi:hypothetical protein